MKLNIVFFALMFAPEAQAMQYFDACRSDRTTQEYPDRRQLPVCGSAMLDCPSHPRGCTPHRESRTFPNCAALVEANFQFEHFGACKPNGRVQGFVVGIRVSSYEECIEKAEKLEAIPVDVLPWRRSSPQGIDISLGRETYCRGLFPHGAIPGPRTDGGQEPDGRPAGWAPPPPAVPEHPRPAAPSYPGGILPDGTVYR